MVKIDYASGIEVFHHQQVRSVTPIFHLDLTLSCFFHSVHEHSSEMLTLGSQDCLMAINWFLLHEKNDVCESGVIDNGSHVAD